MISGDPVAPQSSPQERASGSSRGTISTSTLRKKRAKVTRTRQALQKPGLEPTPDRARRSSLIAAFQRDQRAGIQHYPRRGASARRFTVLFDQILHQFPERLAFLLFLQDPGNVTRNRIGSSGFDFPVDSRQLILGQTDGDLRSGDTSIIPFLSYQPPKPSSARWQRVLARLLCGAAKLPTLTAGCQSIYYPAQIAKNRSLRSRLRISSKWNQPVTEPRPKEAVDVWQFLRRVVLLETTTIAFH